MEAAGPVVVFDRDRQELLCGVSVVRVGRRGARLVGVLAEAGTAIVSDSRMLGALYFDRPECDPDSPKVLIHRLRRAFRDAGFPVLIQTVWGHGYRLTQPIEIVSRTPEVHLSGPAVGLLRDLLGRCADHSDLAQAAASISYAAFGV